MDHLLSRRAAGASSSAIRDLLRLVERPGVLSLAGGLPAGEGFPVERLRAATSAALDAPGRYGTASLQYGPTEGDDLLRAILAARSGSSTAEVLVTTGSQQALDLVGRAVLDPGDVVVVEAPAYVGTIQALRGCEPRFAPVAVDADGLRVELLAAQLAGGLRPKLVATVPNFQNPTGATLSLERRRLLCELADRYGFLVVEDDPYGELRFRGTALAPVRTWSDRVVTLGSLSKVLAPGLRIGWAVAPEWLHGPLVRLKQAADLHTSSFAQRIAADVLADRAFVEAHVAELRELYRARCDALVGALPACMDARVPDGGMFVWGRVDASVDTTSLLPEAVEVGVAYVPGAAFHVEGGGADEMRLSFATLRPDELVDAAGRLATVLDRATRAARASIV